MAIPNTVTQMRSGIVGTLAKESPSRVRTAILDYDLDTEAQNDAAPSRACTYTDDRTVTTGGTGEFAGLILGNQRVLSDAGESLHQSGDVVELVVMGEMFVNIDLGTDPKRGDGVYFENATGKLGAGTAGEGQTQIANAVIDAVGDDGYLPGKPTLARIVLTGPVA